jgi:hypothetical protein
MESKIDRSKLLREAIVEGLLNSIPDVLIAGVAAIITGTGWIGFFIVLIGLQCVYFLIWLKKTLWSWVVFRLYERHKRAERLEDYLVRERFPPPPEYVNGMNWYLSDIRDSKANDFDLRLKADNLMNLREPVGLQEGLQAHYVLEDAFQRYARRFPRPQVDEE